MNRSTIILILIWITIASRHFDSALTEIRADPKSFDWKGRNENCDFLCKKLGGSICGTNFYDCCAPENCKVLYNMRVCVKPIPGYTCDITKKAGSLFGELKDQLGQYDR